MPARKHNNSSSKIHVYKQLAKPNNSDDNNWLRMRVYNMKINVLFNELWVCVIVWNYFITHLFFTILLINICYLYKMRHSDKLILVICQSCKSAYLILKVHIGSKHAYWMMSRLTPHFQIQCVMKTVLQNIGTTSNRNYAFVGIKITVGNWTASRIFTICADVIM